MHQIGHNLVKFKKPSLPGPPGQCKKCRMMGPSPQTGKKECSACSLCEKCCGKDNNCRKNKTVPVVPPPPPPQILDDDICELLYFYYYISIFYHII